MNTQNLNISLQSFLDFSGATPNRQIAKDLKIQRFVSLGQLREATDFSWSNAQGFALLASKSRGIVVIDRDAKDAPSHPDILCLLCDKPKKAYFDFVAMHFALQDEYYGQPAFIHPTSEVSTLARREHYAFLDVLGALTAPAT